ncbi:hypothetical protein B0O99DRAFT_621160 [Bisporella sp. PMI_857]|nr:hypothetical protein B0O99DRAFT_621160 [Bisporella sp. PMI_857]
MPTFTVLPVTLADSVDITRNNMSACWTNPSWRLSWTNVNKTLPYHISQVSLRTPHNLVADPARRRHQKAVNESGELVGYCRWVLPEGDPEETGKLWKEAKVKEAEELGEEEKAKLKRDYDSADFKPDSRLDVLDEPMSTRKKELMAKKNYFVLDFLTVHPDHRKQGIATKLVESGLREAEKFGFDVFVLAMEPALGLYQRTGFTLLDQFECDDSEFGGEGKYRWYLLEYIVNKE